MITQETGNGINYHLFETDKYKTNIIVVLIRTSLERENATKNKLLTNILKSGTNNFKTFSEIYHEAEKLYGAVFELDIVKKGEEQIIQMYFEALSDKYTMGEQLLEKYPMLIKEILFNPLVSENCFNEEIVDREKESVRQLIRSRVNDKKKYALERCLEEMCKDEKFGVLGDGYEEDIDALNGKNMYEYYVSLIKSAPIEMILIGDVNDENAKESVKTIFDINRGNITKIPPAKIVYEVNSENEVFEDMGSSSGKLVIGARCGGTIKGESYYDLLVANSILGGSANSKLFLNVRENNSLCYYINSVIYRFKLIMIIQAGVAKEDYDKAKELIKAELENIKNGQITEEEIQVAKRSLTKYFESTKDSPQLMADYYLSSYIASDNTTIDEMKQNIQNVTKERIINCVQKINFDTFYFLS